MKIYMGLKMIVMLGEQGNGEIAVKTKKIVESWINFATNKGYLKKTSTLQNTNEIQIKF